jgi:predicted DNA-binding transcriptional regulator YafY
MSSSSPRLRLAHLKAPSQLSTVELVSWVLGFGDQTEVLEPDSLREQVAAELARASARYAARVP